MLKLFDPLLFVVGAAVLLNLHFCLTSLSPDHLIDHDASC